MQGFLLCAASVAVLVGLVALVEASRPRRGGQGGAQASSLVASKLVHRSHG
jgi:hypothetical protein